MTEKERLQAKHRQEEQEIRDKIKERKRRTRRLIQEGAILESVFPGGTKGGLGKAVPVQGGGKESLFAAQPGGGV